MSVTETHDAEPVLVALTEDLDDGFVELFGAYRPCRQCRPTTAVAARETS